MKLTLWRHAYLDACTLGWLQVNTSALTLATLSEPWIPDPFDGKGGQRRGAGIPESCVPDGAYNLVPHDTEKHPNVWALVNPTLDVFHLPGDIPAGRSARSAILIHQGNTVTDTEGCILVGMRFGMMGGSHAVLESRKALDMLRAALGASVHQLDIRPTLGTKQMW